MALVSKGIQKRQRNSNGTRDLISRANEALRQSREIVERAKEIKFWTEQIREKRRGSRNGQSNKKSNETSPDLQASVAKR